MNITEFMSFDLGWFTTLPGMLITGGVVVLLIALIIFIVSNKKDKKKTPVVAPVENANTMGPVNDNNMGMPINDMTSVPNMPMDNGVSMNNDSSAMDLNSVNNVNGGINTDINMNSGFAVPSISDNMNQPVTNNIDNSVNAAPAPGVIDFSNPTPVTPVTDNSSAIPEINNIQEPSNAQEVSSIPSVNNSFVGEVTPTSDSIAASPIPTVSTPEPTVMPSIEPATPVVDTTPVVPTVPETPAVEEKPAPTIYGGVNPANTVMNNPAPEVKPVIYGGANPLENTTTIPRVTNHEAYNMGGNTNPAPSISQEPITMPKVEEEQPAVNPTVATPSIPVMPSVTPAKEPAAPAAPTSSIPMTGAEMFGSTDDNSNSTSNNSGGEIETLEF